MKVRDKEMTLSAVSLFTGAGGLDYGFEAAGFMTRAAIDNDPQACATLRLNRKWPVIQRAIADVSSEEIMSAAKLSVGEADILIGGPPCQPFSKSGYWARGDSRRLDDPRSNTLEQYLRVLRDLRPKAFLLENVPGLAFKGKNEGIEALRLGIACINFEIGTNYSIEFRSINAASFGIPQLRERVFVIGERDGLKFTFPEATHGPLESRSAHNLEPYRTAWDALADLPPVNELGDLKVNGKWASLLPSIPEGHNYLWHTERGGGEPLFGWRRRYWNFLLKLAKDKPSWTIQAQPGPSTGPFHWDNRRLSAQELCRLQTFPKDIHFDCKHADAHRLIGNAVPSALSEVLARNIARQFFRRTDIACAPSLIPKMQTEVPAPSKHVAVARRFRHLIGSDTAHPGKGLGRGALDRLMDAT